MAQMPERSNRVYRVRQLPSHIKFHELASLLQQALNYNGPIHHIHVFSLAPSIDSTDEHPTKTATVGFVAIPDALSTHENEWTFRVLGVSHTIIVDTHFLGFTTLNDVRPEDHKFDCFAISGLASHPFGSWKPHNTSSSFMWLRDALPQYLPTARIITYGYDTNLVGSQSFQTIEDIAISLIAKLRSIGSTLLSAKPTIFLAHSLGGVALKQALVHLANSAKQDYFLSKIQKIIFFGVPNRGMKVAHLLPMVQDQPNETLVRLLSEESKYLSLLDEQFSGISFVRRMHLVSVYETQRSQVPLEVEPGRWKRGGPFEILVKKESAIHRFSDDSDIYPVNKNHSDLVKFSEDDSDLKTILDVMRNGNRTCPGRSDLRHPQIETNSETVDKISTESLPPIGKIYDSSYEERSEYREQVTTLLDSLRRDEAARRYDQVSNAHKLTFDWVFEKGGVGLTEWLKNDGGLFWINGKPGSGKSTVMKHICKYRYQKGRFKAERKHKSSRSRACSDKEVSVHDQDTLNKHVQECLEGSDSTGSDCSDEAGNESGGRMHGESPGETDAHFFFSHRGSEIQKSLEGLLHCVLYEVLSRGAAERLTNGALRGELLEEIANIAKEKEGDSKRMNINVAKKDNSTKEMRIDRLKAQYDTAAEQAQNRHIWRHENAQLLHTLLQDRSGLPPVRMINWTAADLDAALLQILTQQQVQIKITLFLDALDEYARNPKKIVKFLERAVRQTKHSMTKLKICFTSRPWDIFKDHFVNQPGFCMQKHTVSDIDNYAKARMRRHITAHTMTEAVGLSLRLRVLERAEGVFLWVRLVLDTILVELVHVASPRELHRLLEAFPDGLEDLYITTLTRIESRYRRESYVMLEIVLRSELSMKFDHFYQFEQSNPLSVPSADPDGDIILDTTSSHLSYLPKNGNDLLVRSKPLHLAGNDAMLQVPP